MKILVFLLSLFLFLVSLHVVYAQDILFSTEQTEYYFKIGEEALIPIEINSTYGKQISGNLQYTTTHQINQGNVQFSNSNTESKSLVINEENQKISLDLGTSDTPSNLIMNLNFNYNENGDRTVSLGPILIHFVSNDSQKNNQQQNKPQSSSQPITQSQQQELFSQQEQQMEQRLNELFQNPQDLFSQQEQQMEQRLNELLQNQQNPSQNQQQRLQNNQLSQDSSSLKQQMQKQVQKQEQIKKEFEKQLSSNNDFLNRHQKLLEDGYNVTNDILNPMSNDTGSFDIKYKNANDGKWATLQGNMKNGTITELKQQTQDQQEKLLEKLKQNSLFQQFHNQLVTKGFSQNDINFQDNENETNIILQYENQKHQNAKITANFENDEIKSVTLEDNSSNPPNLILLIFLVVAIVSTISVYFVIRKFFLKKKTVTINDPSPTPLKLNSFENIIEPKKLISQAQQYYDQGEYKEAFGTAGKAIRLFLSHDTGLKREITSQELMRSIQKHNNYPIDAIRECLKITDLVEFAKSNATEDDFKKIISLFNKLSNKQTINKN